MCRCRLLIQRESWSSRAGWGVCATRGDGVWEFPVLRWRRGEDTGVVSSFEVAIEVAVEVEVEV